MLNLHVVNPVFVGDKIFRAINALERRRHRSFAMATTNVVTPLGDATRDDATRARHCVKADQKLQNEILNENEIKENTLDEISVDS